MIYIYIYVYDLYIYKERIPLIDLITVFIMGRYFKARAQNLFFEFGFYNL